jgi:DNA-binding MarR family transcriptional regulator
MSTSGYIKLWRRMLDSEVFVDAGVLQLFLAILMDATHKTAKRMLKLSEKESVVVDLQTGQHAFTIRQQAERLAVSKDTLQRRLAKLEALECIVREPTPKYIRVTIRNWERYQETQEGVLKTSTPTSTPSSTPSGSDNSSYKKNKNKRSRALSDQKLSIEKFEEWYNLYPRHQARGHAEVAYERALVKIDHETLCELTRKFADSDIGRGPKKYIPYPATWLNGERWLDEPEENSDQPVKRCATQKELAEWIP